MNSFAGSARGRAAGQPGRGGVRQHDVSFFGLHFRADAVESERDAACCSAILLGRAAAAQRRSIAGVGRHRAGGPH